MRRLRHRFAVEVDELSYFRFRRWMRARDPDAVLKTQPADEKDRWLLQVETDKRYLADRARKRWVDPSAH
jgi:hypothetical protein